MQQVLHYTGAVSITQNLFVTVPPWEVAALLKMFLLQDIHSKLLDVDGVTTVSLNLKFSQNFHRVMHGKYMQIHDANFTAHCDEEEKIKVSVS